LKFKNRIQVFYELLRMLDYSNKRELILVTDTNALIKVPEPSRYSSVVYHK